MCNGYAVFGQKTDNTTKKANDFKGLIDNSFAVVKVKEGLNSVSCSSDGFNGIDPFPDGEKASFCDQKMKYFDNDTVNDINTYWESEGTII